MSDCANIERRTVEAALRNASKDADALELILGKQEKAIERSPALGQDPTLDPPYDGTHMGLVDDLKRLGGGIARKWSRSLHEVVCGKGDSEERKKLFDALSLGEAAQIAAVASLLLPLTGPAIAAAAAPLIVRKFLTPAVEEVCDFWAEKLDEA
jgi:hypothetical protein